MTPVFIVMGIALIGTLAFLIYEIFRAPTKPDCYGMSWCFGDCDNCSANSKDHLSALLKHEPEMDY